MADPFVGEIRPFPYHSTPQGWAPCEGQLLNISQNQALYAVIGNMYGGDGVKTFALPDLRGRTPVMPNGSIQPGMMGGEETHKLTIQELPGHNHVHNGADLGTTNSAPGNVWASTASVFAYSESAGGGLMNPQAIQKTGEGAAHNNMQPYLALQFCIALTGIFPTKN